MSEVAGTVDVGTGKREFAGALLLALVLGSLHAYSVLLSPLEQALGITRSTAGLAYSLAIVALTVAVLVVPALRRRLGPAGMAVAVGLCGAGGLLLAAHGGTGISLLLGYGLLFGFANGIGYGLFLERAAAARPRHPGLAIGTVTAAYAVGAMVFATALGSIVAREPASIALTMLAAAVAAGSLAAALAFRGGAAHAGKVQSAEQLLPRTRPPARDLALDWIVYFLGATGGLMAIGHAAGILATTTASPDLLSLAPVLLALGNIGGSVLGGRLADRLGPGVALGGINAFSALATLALAFAATPLLVLALLACTGFAYGALISLVPALLARRLGRETGAWAFGRVFTAWGAAGLLGPWLAGALYDATGGYRLALAIAASLAAAGALAALLMTHRCQAHA